MNYRQLEECPYCGKEFYCDYVEQIPGFRDKEDKVCPHCKKILRTSMEYEFYTHER